MEDVVQECIKSDAARALDDYACDSSFFPFPFSFFMTVAYQLAVKYNMSVERLRRRCWDIIAGRTIEIKSGH